MGNRKVQARNEAQQIRQLFAPATVRAVVSGFLLDRRSRGRAAGTIDYYADELARFCKFCDESGTIYINELTPDLLRLFVAKLQETRNRGGVSAGWRAVHALLNWYDDEYEPDDWRNPAGKVKVPAASKRPLPGVALETVYAMIAANRGAQKERDELILLSLLDTGLRAAEFVALNIGDVDLVRGAVWVWHGKGDKPRTVALGRECRKLLRRYLKSRPDAEPDDPLYANDDGGRFTYNSLYSLLRRRAADAGVPTPSPHDFRRAFAVEMLRRGCDLPTLSELMGHESLEVTRRYLALVEDDLLDAHARAGPVDHKRRKK